MSIDWQTASDRLNRFRTLDSDLQYDTAVQGAVTGRQAGFLIGRGQNLRDATAILREQTEERLGEDIESFKRDGGALGVIDARPWRSTPPSTGSSFF